MRASKILNGLIVLIAAAGAAPVMAHVSPTHADGFLSGMVHPFTGVDHLLILLAVGLWCGWMRSQMCIPFRRGLMLGLVGGGAWAAVGASVPLAPAVVLISMVLLAGSFLSGKGLNAANAGGVVAVLAFFHGYFHMAAIAVTVQGMLFAAALWSASVLFVVGVMELVRCVPGAKARRGVRMGGLAAALAGLWLAVGA